MSQQLTSQQITAAFKPMMEEIIAKTTEQINARHDQQMTELTLALKELKTQNDLILTTINTPKKAIQRSAAPKDGAPAAEGGAEAPQVKKFANKLVWFRAIYKTSEEFRKKYTTSGAKAEIDNSAEKFANKSPEVRLGNEGNIAYAHVKNDPALLAELTAAYEQYNREFEEKQVTPEQESPKK